MDRLSDLPPSDGAQMSPQESDVMQKYFSAPPNSPASTNSKTKVGWMDAIKMAFYVAVLFVFLANPWIDSVMCMVPYCGDSSMILLAVKTLLFMVLFVTMYKFVI